MAGVARNFVEVGPHDAPESRQRDRRLARKQRAAQLPLQRADGAGQRGLRDAATPGGAGETELLAQRQEVLHLLHLQWCCPPRWARRSRQWLGSGAMLQGEGVTGRRGGPWAGPELF